MKRRDFFSQGGRLAILSGIGLYGTFLGAQQKIVTPGNCSFAPFCKNCGKFIHCELPQAKKERRNGK